MEYAMLSERRTPQAKKIRREMLRAGKDWSPRRAKELVPRTDGLVQALNTGLTMDHYVLVFPKSTNTQLRSTNDTTRSTKTMETPQKSTQTASPTSTSWLAGSLAKRLASRVRDLDLTKPEAHSSLTSLGFSKLKNQECSYWKTSKGFFLTTTEELSKPSSPRLLGWGMASSGKCLTARISASPKTGKGCSLSDILEKEVEERYFLSPETADRILNEGRRNAFVHTGGGQSEYDTFVKDTQKLSDAKRVRKTDGNATTLKGLGGAWALKQDCT